MSTEATRPTMTPPALPERVETPPGIAAARAPSSPPYVDAGVAKVDLISRRLLRGVCALVIAYLTYHGDATGHPVSGVTVAVIGALGMGLAAAADAARKRPGLTAAGGAGLVLVALLGELVDVHELGSAAALGVAGVTALVDRARGA